ncbi:ATP-binding protein [Embleya sp. AB8]|uniref:ATP-binding protein n=1 Tax=Embleya sp. AB8 TaxID=3156304 RepID=UPI003C77AD32
MPEFTTKAPPMALVELPMTVHAPKQAREYIAAVCAAAGLEADIVAMVLIVVSELVTNAVRHVGHGLVSLDWELRNGRLIVDVGDDAPQKLPHAQWVSDDTEGGRGLLLVLSFTEQYVVMRADGHASRPPRKISRVAFPCSIAGLGRAFARRVA